MIYFFALLVLRNHYCDLFGGLVIL